MLTYGYKIISMNIDFEKFVSIQKVKVLSNKACLQTALKVLC